MAGAKRWVPPLDAMFLWGETTETMFHVASLMPYTPPAGAGPEFLREVYEEMRAAPVCPPWNQRLTHPHILRHPRQSWVADEHFDIDYHVRRSALPSPGDERELGVVVSRLHSHQLDFSRPPWEVHLIEGLEGGRFAVYTKVHHSLVDGYTATRIQQRSMSPDPDDRSVPYFFSVNPWSGKPHHEHQTQSERSGLLAVPGRAVDTAAGAARATARTVGSLAGAGVGTARAVARLELHRGDGTDALIDPVSAPDTIFNARTGRNRRLATQQYDLTRVRSIAHAADGTVNDVVMAVCGGGVRRYLDEMGELPAKPLVAFVPVNIRPDGDEGGGNRVGVSLASMGTHLADPVQRMEAVIASTSQAKQQISGMRQLTILAYSGFLLAPAAAQVVGAITGLAHVLPKTINLVLSNLAGPKETLYMRGARCEAIYPISIPVHGMALNITLESYAGTLCFGFVGCRDAVPSLQRLAVHTGEALDELAAAYGVD
jgi:diacylglycerol O-acyltransferase / wax synthase